VYTVFCTTSIVKLAVVGRGYISRAMQHNALNNLKFLNKDSHMGYFVFRGKYQI